MPAMASKLPDESGAVTNRMIDFYVARARGGVGLIITENTCIDWPTGKAAQNPLRIDDDKYIMGLNDLAEAVQASAKSVQTLADGSLAKNELDRTAKFVSNRFATALKSNQWKETFRGRDILRRFVGKYVAVVSYDVFRDLILARMCDDTFQPNGMRDILNRIIEK